MEDSLVYDGKTVVIVDDEGEDKAIAEETAEEATDEGDEEVAEDEAAVDFSKLKVTELRQELTKRGLDTKGVKATLIKRLNESNKVKGKRNLDKGGRDEIDEQPPAKKVAVEKKEQEQEAAIDWTALKVAELRAELSKRGLNTKGVKTVLISRLQECSSGGADEMQVDEESSEEEEEAESTLDFTSMKVAELRAELSKRKLDTKGVKAVLIKRLEENVKA